MNPYYKKIRTLNDAVDVLNMEILGYESDTFSADGSELTDYEAVEVAEYIAQKAVESALEHLDGIAITDALEEVRAQAKHKKN